MLVDRQLPLQAYSAFFTPWRNFLEQVLVDGNALTHRSPPMYLQRGVFLELFAIPGGRVDKFSFSGLVQSFFLSLFSSLPFVCHCLLILFCCFFFLLFLSFHFVVFQVDSKFDLHVQQICISVLVKIFMLLVFVVLQSTSVIVLSFCVLCEPHGLLFTLLALFLTLVEFAFL